MNFTDISTVGASQADLRKFFSITKAWQLTPAEAQTILDVDTPTFEFLASQNVEEPLSPEIRNRISCVLEIDATLHILLPIPERADAWVKTPNTASLFAGEPALNRLLTGKYDDLYAVTEYLLSQLNGDFG